MKNKIWVVYGFAGQYSSYEEWPVGWYLTEKEAKRAVELLTKFLDIFSSTGKEMDYSSSQKATELMKNFDQNFSGDFSAIYSYYKLAKGTKIDNLDVSEEKIQMLKGVHKC